MENIIKIQVPEGFELLTRASNNKEIFLVRTTENESIKSRTICFKLIEDYKNNAIEHYGKFLAWAGSPIIYKSRYIERKINEKQSLIEKLKRLELEIAQEERDFENLIASDWTKEEIKEAKQKADNLNFKE